MRDFCQQTGYGNYPDLSAIRRVLVIHFKNIGDMILSEPVCRLLHEKVQPERLDVLVNQGMGFCFDNHPAVNQVYTLKKQHSGNKGWSRLRDFLRLKKCIKNNQYDLIVALNHSSRIELLIKNSGASIRVGRLKKHPKAYTHKVPPAPASRHYVDRHLDVLRRIGLFADPSHELPVYYPEPAANTEARQLLSEHGLSAADRYCLIHPCSRWMFKCAPPQHIAGFINQISETLKIPIVITSGPDNNELAYIQRIHQGLKHAVIDLSGKTSLPVLAELIREAAVCISVDTAALHIAEATTTPVVALFGPSLEKDWGPRSGISLTLTDNRHTCRPCGMDGCAGSKVSACLENLEYSRAINFLHQSMSRA